MATSIGVMAGARLVSRGVFRIQRASLAPTTSTETHMRLISPIVLLLGLSLSSAAVAQSVGVACKIKELCAGEAPGGGRIMECLRAHKSELSEKCLAAIGFAVLNRPARAPQGSPSAAPGAPAGQNDMVEPPAAATPPGGAPPDQSQTPK